MHVKIHIWKTKNIHKWTIAEKNTALKIKIFIKNGPN